VALVQGECAGEADEGEEGGREKLACVSMRKERVGWELYKDKCPW